VQRRLTGLGFDTKVTGTFNDETRAVIKRWQTARGYPSTGFYNKLQHKALLTEIVPSMQAGAGGGDDRPARRAPAPVRQSNGGGGGGGGQQRGGGEAGAAFIGGMMGGVLGGAFRR
jgi:hypothetical protein